MGGLIWGAWYGGPGMVRTFQTLITQVVVYWQYTAERGQRVGRSGRCEETADFIG